MGNFLPSYKCGSVLQSYPMECKRFNKSPGTIFRYNKFATDDFMNNISSIVFEIIKFVSVTRFQICTIVVTIYIR